MREQTDRQTDRQSHKLLYYKTPGCQAVEDVPMLQIKVS